MLDLEPSALNLLQILTIQSGALTLDGQRCKERSSLCPLQFNVVVRCNMRRSIDNPRFIVVHEQFKVWPITIPFVQKAYGYEFDTQFMSTNTSDCCFRCFAVCNPVRGQTPDQRKTFLIGRAESEQSLALRIVNNYRDSVLSWFGHGAIISSLKSFRLTNKNKTELCVCKNLSFILL